MLTLDYKLAELDYDGLQLVSHFIYKTRGIVGNAGIFFIGKMNVPITNMCDIEDVLANKHIYSEKAINVIFEFFDKNLEETILLQRLFVRIVEDELKVSSLEPGKSFIVIGNDLFFNDKKMSVSIATSSPVSTLIHYGINISSKNTPIVTAGLEDLLIDPVTFIGSVFNTFLKEYNALIKARCKVRGVQ